MPAARERLARSCARSLLQELGVQVLPVDPFEIAKNKKPPILVVERALPHDIFGACGFLDGAFAIAISKSCPTPGHRRFTAGHELGHYHIEGHVESLFARREGWVPSQGAHFQAGADRLEREADYFASELLMPEALVRPLLRGQPGLSQVRRIADDCAVSLSSAAITMTRLTREPVVVLLSKNGVLEWPAFSAALSEYPWAHTRLKGEWAPPRSSTKRLALDASAVREAEVLDGEGLLCEWMPDAPEWAAVVEEAMGLGDYGRVLTILRPGPLPDPDQEQEQSWRRLRDEQADEDDWDS